MFAKLLPGLVVIAATGALAWALWWSAKVMGIYSPLFALVVTWLPTAWMRIIYAVRPILLSEAYYRLRVFERPLYRILMVKVAKRVVASRMWAGVNPRFRDLCRRDGLPLLETQMRHAETSHLLVFLAVLPLVALAFWNGRFSAAGFLLLLNVLLNGYPVMVQRFNRRRLGAALRRLEARPPSGRPSALTTRPGPY